MTRRDPVEAGLVDAEDRRDPLEIDEFRLVDHAVGAGDGEESVDHVLQRLPVVLEKPGDSRRVGFEARDVLLGEIEQAGDMPFLATATWRAAAGRPPPRRR